jgi:DNA helicase-2/ATP-dependent DNA helicase PcrA
MSEQTSGEPPRVAESSVLPRRPGLPDGARPLARVGRSAGPGWAAPPVQLTLTGEPEPLDPAGPDDEDETPPARPSPPRLTRDGLRELLEVPYTEEQLAAICAPAEPGVIVAGAGSGKTSVMAARVVWLIGHEDVPAERILGLTFTRKAAAELAERIGAALARLRRSDFAATAVALLDDDDAPDGYGSDRADDGVGEPTVATYNAFASRLVADHALRLGLEPDCALLPAAARYQLAAHVARAHQGPIEALTAAIPALVSDIVALDGQCGEHLVEPADLIAFDRRWLADLLAALDRAAARPRTATLIADLRRLARTARRRIELAGLVTEYRQARRQRELLDYGDQIQLAARLARQVPEVGALLRRQYSVVLLDEYQDTSIAQCELLAGLFGGGHPVTAVGDPAQAIYGWRGASVGNLRRFPEHFRRSDGAAAAVYQLTVNQRSGGRLLTLANAVAAALPPDARSVTLRPRPQAALAGETIVALHTTWPEEAGWIAAQVAAARRAATVGPWDPPPTCAVLARSWSDVPALVEALTGQGMAVEVLGLGGLLAKPEIADIRAILEVLDDPMANPALMRLLAGPRLRLGPRDLAALGRRAAALARASLPGPPARPAGARPVTDLVVPVADRSGPGADRPGARPVADRPGPVADPPGAWPAADRAESGADPAGPAASRGGSGPAVDRAGRAADPATRGVDTAGPVMDPATGTADDPGALAEAVADVDPSDVVSLADALADPGPEVSAEAARRLRDFAAELAQLRAHAGAGLVELVLRVVEVTGLDVELELAAPQGARGRENLAAFLRVAAEFERSAAGYDDASGRASLTSFLGYLGAGERYERGLDADVSGTGQAVQVLTMHGAKGLEWDVVAVPGMSRSVFPDTQPGDRWITAPEVLPTPLRGDAVDLPAFEVTDGRAALDGYAEQCREQAEQEERRLAYVAFTRARTTLIASGHWWGPAQKLPRGPSPFLLELAEHARGAGNGRIDHWADTPLAKSNPFLEEERAYAWPAPPDPAADAARREAADAVRDLLLTAQPAARAAAVTAAGAGYAEPEAAVAVEPVAAAAADPDVAAAGAAASRLVAGVSAADDRSGMTPAERALLAELDQETRLLIDEALASRAPVRTVALPTGLTATQVMKLSADPAGLARELVRPLPRRPVPAAGRGVRFHAWVEEIFDSRPLLDPEDLPGAEDDYLDDAQLRALKEAFLAGPYGARRPLAVEAPFELPLGGRIIRGRIDAVYDLGAGRYEVVDWKTGVTPADPVQLALYRLAWSRLRGVPADAVDAAFYYVLSSRVVRPALPAEQTLVALLGGSPSR